MYCCDKSLTRPLLSPTNNNIQETHKSDHDGQRGRRRGRRRKLANDFPLTRSSSYENFDHSDSEGEVEFEGDYSHSGSCRMTLRQLGLLVWKNALFRRRHYIVTALEVILPTLLAMLMAYMRTKAPQDASIQLASENNTYFPVIHEAIMLSHAGKELSGHSAKNILAFVPNNALARKIMDKVKNSVPGKYELEGFNKEEEIEVYLAQIGLNKSDHAASVRAAVVFDRGVDNPSLTSFPPRHTISYKIRMVDVYGLELTDELFPWFQLPGPNTAGVVNYVNSGFSGLQIAVDKALMSILTGSEAIQEISAQAFPYPPYSGVFDFKQVYFIMLPQFLVLGFIFIVPSIIRNVVSEKETGIKELMKMMGLPNWMHWLGWMINSLIVLVLTITIVVCLFFISFDSKSGAVIAFSDPTVWWFVLFLYIMAATSFCFFISTFFQRPTLATTAGIVLWLVSYYVPVLTLEPKYQNLSTGDKMLSGLIPNVALYWAIKALCSFEGKSVGSHWYNIAEPISSVDDLSVGLACLWLILNIILYTVLTVYFESIIPSEYGVRKPWYYIFKRATWIPRRATDENRINSSRIDVEPSEDRPGFEAEPPGLHAGVVLKDLTKRFGSRKVAVDGVSFKMYDGQITALLGHNGAGKTTTMSMLTGLFGPTSGTATVNGYDINKDMDRIRSSMGLCPQHNMLFDKLTVEEHLIFFGRLKGLTSKEAEIEMKTLLEKLQLREKRNVLSMALSGGQKRKLSLGMALIGGTKTVILDEVSSGMDPEARRAIWDLLLEMRGERTIVLTTHFMEEADVLGDRIAIMAGGQIKCCGTPMFLKKYYGAGYTLKMTTSPQSDNAGILSAVQTHVPNAVFRSQQAANTSELAITLPNESQTTSHFPDLFTELSDRKEKFGIQTIGLSLTTMDEVFVKVGESQNDEHEKSETSDAASDSSRRPIGTTKILMEDRLTGLRLASQQFYGLVRKRIIYTVRKRRLFFSQFFMPLVLLIIAILLSNRSFLPSPSPHSLKMSLAAYKKPVTMYSYTDQALGTKYADLLAASTSVLVTNGSVEENLVSVGVQDLGLYRAKYIVAADMNATSVNALFSSIPHHASPLSINLLSNAILKNLAADKDYNIEVANHPLKSALSSLLEASQPNPSFSTVVPVLFGVFLTIGLALFAASFIVFPVEEKLCKAKQLQLMTGVNPLVFWGSSFVWDFLVMSLLICLMVICFPIFQTFGAFTVYGGAGVIFLILMVYGFSSISFSYLCSVFVQTVPGGFSFVTIVHIVTGMILSMVVYFLEDAHMGDDTVIVREIGRLFPAFGASVCIMRFTAISTRNSRCNILSQSSKDLICNPEFEVSPELRQCCANCANFTNPDGESCFRPEPYLTWISNPDAPHDIYKIPGVGQDLFYLLLVGFIYLVLLMFIEFGLLKEIGALIFRSEKGSFQTPVNDEDVLEENERVKELVANGHVNEDAFVVENLCKSYGSLGAVSKLSFGVHHGECFGLLGVNGAGKTTTFRMLTGDEIRSNGNAYTLMYTLQNHRKQFLSSIGYCPQFDGIVGVLSGQEMLELFCRLRGVQPDAVEREAHKWLHNLGLFESRNVQCQKYSGGMKRRLSAAMALIGDPPVVLLDEPTTGVDPIARRQFWSVLSAVRDSGQAVVLTSHSMEECEALCSRLGIMVNGQFQCLGGVEHLKNKFAQGYSLVVKLKPLLPLDSPEVMALCGQISIKFNPCTLKDQHQNILQYQVLNTTMSWGQIYRATEDLKTQFADVIEDYTVSETTLEEVFLSFARKQYSNRDANVSFFKKLITCQCCQ